MSELKRLSTELDSKLSRGMINKGETVRTEQEEDKLSSEIDCMRKMLSRYEKEIETLKGKVEVKTGPERVVELDRAIQQGQKKQEETNRRIKELEKKLKDTGKEFEKDSEDKETWSEKAEVRTIIIFDKMIH